MRLSSLATTFISNRMAMLFYVLAGIFSISMVEGKGCWAGKSPGSECIYNTAIPGGDEFEITYQVNSNFSSICCQALECQISSCSFVYVFCGQGELTASPLLWAAVSVNVNPMMRCYGEFTETFYSYTAAVLPS